MQGRVQTINEITLNRFIHHSIPAISQMLRWKDFDNLNSAYTAALAEERALNIQKPKSKFCKICKKNNHDTSHCRNKSINMNTASSPNTNYNHKNNSKVCNYCKKRGHLISECRKRQYNNSKKQTQNTPNNSGNAINLNSTQSPMENTSLVDQISNLTVFEN